MLKTDLNIENYYVFDNLQQITNTTVTNMIVADLCVNCAT